MSGRPITLARHLCCCSLSTLRSRLLFAVGAQVFPKHGQWKLANPPQRWHLNQFRLVELFVRRQCRCSFLLFHDGRFCIMKALLLRGQSDRLARSPHGVRPLTQRRTLFDRSRLFRICFRTELDERTAEDWTNPGDRNPLQLKSVLGRLLTMTSS